MNRFVFVLIVMSISYLAKASDTLTLVQFQDIVFNHHPLIKSANLNSEIAEAYLIKGEGILDPKFYSNFDGKQFKEQNYFRRWNNELKIPTKYPVDISLGYENNSGDFLNSENFLPTNGLVSGTLNISLLRGLLFDEQRFALRESELLAGKSEIERELVIRNVIIESINAYVEWSTAFGELEILESYLGRVTERHEFVKQLFENGDKPALDTIESRINLNTATKDKINATEKLWRKKQKLSMFLWSNASEPLALSETVVPQDIAMITDDLLVNTFAISQNWHADPIIRKKQIELEQVNLENRLEREQLKPQLDLKLNSLVNLGDNDLAVNYSVNDYKLGAALVVPIRNRKSRGQIRLNEALIAQNELNQEYYLSELQNMYNMLSRTEELNREALLVSEEKVENSKLLYAAEQIKFGIGESSVFLLNSRERKLLEAETEYLKNLKALSYIYSQLYFLKLGQEN